MSEQGLIERVGVVGCGLMGSGIAEVSARAGLDVVVREVDGLPLVVAAIARDLARHGATIVAGPTLQRVVGRVTEQVVVGDNPALDRRQRDLLSRVALLGRASVDEAQHMMAVDDVLADAVLDQAVESGLARWDDAEEIRTIVLSPASARALTVQMRSEPANAVVLTRAARLNADRGDVYEAVSLSIDARDFRLGIEIGAPNTTRKVARCPTLAHAQRSVRRSAPPPRSSTARWSLSCARSCGRRRSS